MLHTHTIRIVNISSGAVDLALEGFPCLGETGGWNQYEKGGFGIAFPVIISSYMTPTNEGLRRASEDFRLFLPTVLLKELE